jgi:hypothetical protein
MWRNHNYHHYCPVKTLFVLQGGQSFAEQELVPIATL